MGTVFLSVSITHRLECRRTMRRRNHNQHAGLADLKPPQPVNQRHLPHVEFIQSLLRKFLHLFERHLFVGFVVKMQSLPPTRIVANNAVEDDDRAILAAFGLCNELFGLDALLCEGNNDRPRVRILVRSIRHARCTPGDGRQQPHLIAIAQQMAGGCVLGIHADGNAAQELPLPGHAGSQMFKQIRHRGAFRQLDGHRRPTKPIFRYPKGKNSHAHRLKKNTA
jgi:hypothetical protein